jgi:dTDP-4-dehydrorhamnose reductase
MLEIWGNKYDILVLDQTDDSALFEGIRFRKVDITNKEELQNAISEEKPDWVLHLAAFTNVEAAETERELAWDLNVTASRNVAEVVKRIRCKIIYMSTGFVFSGEKETYVEEDPEEPINYYGLTKLEGERAIRHLIPDAVIFRHTFPYRTKWEKKSDTVRWMIPKLLSGEEIKLVNDQFISPNFIDDLSNVISISIDKQSKGIFHIAPEDRLSFYDMGLKVAEEFGVSKDLIKEITLDELQSKLQKKAKSPRYNCLLSSRAQKELGVRMTPFAEGVKKVKESYS